MGSQEPQQAKAKQRSTLLRARQALSDAEWRDKSDRLCAHLQTASLVQQAQTILAYFSVRREPNLSSLFTLPKTWGFPRCIDTSLVWHRWSPDEPLQAGAYGILEPHPELPLLNAREVDLLLVPAVACDRAGYRLGYGGGFYDRLLSSPEWTSKPTIGIVFEFAYLPNLPIDAWDIPLTAVCTETGLYPIPGSRIV